MKRIWRENVGICPLENIWIYLGIGKRLWSDPKSIGITGFFSFANWKKRQKWPSDTKLIPLPLRHRIMSKHPKALKFVFLWTNLRAFFTVFSVVPQFPQTKNFSKISLIPLILIPLKFRISEGTFPYTNSGGFKYGWKLVCQSRWSDSFVGGFQIGSL